MVLTVVLPGAKTEQQFASFTYKILADHREIEEALYLENIEKVFQLQILQCLS